MFATEITAPGEKVDIDCEPLVRHLKNSSTVQNIPPSTHRKRRVSTAHIMPSDYNTGIESFAFDELASICAQFLGSPTVNEDVLHFASNIVTIIGSPTALESEEVKRRIEQVLPTQHQFNYRRGMKISDEDCTMLCSLADRAINRPLGKPNSVEIVDDDIVYSNEDVRKNDYGMNDVQYIRHTDHIRQKSSPYRVNVGFKTEDIEYDCDVTPYGSDFEGQPKP